MYRATSDAWRQLVPGDSAVIVNPAGARGRHWGFCEVPARMLLTGCESFRGAAVSEGLEGAYLVRKAMRTTAEFHYVSQFVSDSGTRIIMAELSVRDLALKDGSWHAKLRSKDLLGSYVR